MSSVDSSRSSFKIISRGRITLQIVDYFPFSTTATTLLWNSIKSPIPGGTIEMEMLNTFGRVAAQMSTHVNVELITIVSMLILNATAAPLRHYN